MNIDPAKKIMPSGFQIKLSLIKSLVSLNYVLMPCKKACMFLL